MNRRKFLQAWGAATAATVAPTIALASTPYEAPLIAPTRILVGSLHGFNAIQLDHHFKWALVNQHLLPENWQDAFTEVKHNYRERWIEDAAGPERVRFPGSHHSNWPARFEQHLSSVDFYAPGFSIEDAQFDYERTRYDFNIVQDPDGFVGGIWTFDPVPFEDEMRQRALDGTSVHVQFGEHKPLFNLV